MKYILLFTLSFLVAGNSYSKDNKKESATTTAAITITSNTGDTACYNTLTGFTATAIADTFAPHYQWVKNGVYTGTDNVIYTPATFATGDQVKCLLYNAVGDTLASSAIITIDSLLGIGNMVCPSVFCLGSVAKIYDDFSIFSSTFYSLNYFSTDSNIVSLSEPDYFNLYATARSLGVDTIYFTAINECGTDSTHQVVNVVPNNLAPIAGPDTVCTNGYATYSDASAGGIWNLFYSGGPYQNINSATGLFSAGLDDFGSVVITYGTYGCTVTDTPYIVTTPYITGPNTVYAYSTILLVGSAPGGTWSSTTDAVATIDPVTGVLLGVSPGVDTVYYTVTYAAGCTFSTKLLVHVLAFSGVANVINDASFTIFPNPASAQVNIRWAVKNEDKGLVRITDISGKQVMSESIDMGNTTTATMDVSKLTPGIYLLSIRTDDSYYYSKLEVQ